MPDFNLKTYQMFLKSLRARDFLFQNFSGFLENPAKKVTILRHDVDLNPSNSLVTARIESDLGIRGSYYFRSVPQSNNPRIIREIEAMGHEIGYHYEDLSLAAERQKTKGERQKTTDIAKYERELAEIAIEQFAFNLAKLRKIVPVKTICMHGSPMSRWDSRLLWKYYDYKDFGLIGEPYFDVDFNEVLYVTDTGRRWDGENFSVRDKIGNRVTGNRYPVIGGVDDNKTEHTKMVRQAHQHKNNKTSDSWKGDKWVNGPLCKSIKMISRDEDGVLVHNFHSTFDIIKAAEENQLPDKIMITVHPQRWTNNPILWTKELVMQDVKNQVKRFIVMMQR